MPWNFTVPKKEGIAAIGLIRVSEAEIDRTVAGQTLYSTEPVNVRHYELTAWYDGFSDAAGNRIRIIIATENGS